MRDMPSQTGYATTNATAVSGAGIVDQKRMHAARTYQWPGVPSRTESSPGRPLLGWQGGVGDRDEAGSDEASGDRTDPVAGF
jgi:hypothetical protein